MSALGQKQTSDCRPLMVAHYARPPMGSVMIAAIQRDRSDIDPAEPFH
jgi:hypothetical protein